MNGSPDNIAAAFGLPSSAPGTYKTRCPAHDDRNPSLSVTLQDNKALVICHAGCTTDAVLQAVGLKPADLFFDDRSVQRREVARYNYGDYVKLRYEPKSFTFIDKTGNPGLNGHEHVLYHLQDIETAKAGGHAVFLCEGEKDANTVRDKMQCFAVSLDCGALPANASPARLKPLDALEGVTVYILPDQDIPGKVHGEVCAKYLQGRAKEMYIVNVPDGKDVSEYFECGHTAEEFRQLCASAEPFPCETSVTGWTVENTRPEWILQEPEPFEFIIPGLLAKGLSGSSTVRAAPIKALPLCGLSCSAVPVKSLSGKNGLAASRYLSASQYFSAQKMYGLTFITG